LTSIVANVGFWAGTDVDWEFVGATSPADAVVPVAWVTGAVDGEDEVGAGVVVASVVLTWGTNGSFALNNVNAMSLPVSARRALVSDEIGTPARITVDDERANGDEDPTAVTSADGDAVAVAAGAAAGGLSCFQSFGP